MKNGDKRDREEERERCKKMLIKETERKTVRCKNDDKRDREDEREM